MTPKIPSSLKWLIDKRARLDAEIKKTEASISKVKNLVTELTKLKDSLAAIDHTLEMHEIKVDIDLIRPVRSHYVRVNLPYGSLTKSILMCIRLNQEEGPVSTSQIVSFITARHADLDVKPEKRVKLNQSVHNRLKILSREGVLKRHHDKKTNKEGLWTLEDFAVKDASANIFES